jgi:hypothetical protein
LILYIIFGKILPYQKGGGVEVMQITYQKKDGSIIQKYRNTTLPYKIGDDTSMGWKVLNVEYEFNGKYYPEYKYNLLLHKDRQMFIKRKLARELYIKEFKNFLYCILAMLVINALKMLLGM